MILYTVVEGQIIGQYRPGAKIVQYIWKNILCGRMKASNPKQQQTSYQGIIKAKLIEYSNRYFQVLTQPERDMWEQYAGENASIIERLSAHTRNVIPKRKKLMNGVNAYTQANIVGFLADGSGANDTAPRGEHIPPPPINVVAVWVPNAPVYGGFTVTWTNPVLVGTPTKKFVRLWIMANTKPKVTSQLKASIVFPPGGSYTFTTIRRGRYTFGIKDTGYGTFRFQMDTIVQRESGQGFIIGPPSNVAEAVATKET